MEIPRWELENNSNAGQPCKSGEYNGGLARTISLSSLRTPANPGTTALPLQAGLLRRTLRGFGEFRRDRRGLRRAAPARRVAAVTPSARAIEGVDAEFIRLLHFADPGRAHPIRVVVGRLVDF